MFKAKELRDKSPEELEDLRREFLREIFELRGRRVDTKADKTHLIGQRRKEIARILTIQKERTS
ncbi:MAG: 50S ribosomal protein L29 [Chlamydiia bacterium]|nr:50S ribosomal protein L29 [Chlamydiia bacterium]